MFKFEKTVMCCLENQARARGYVRIAGMDEAGRGALAGPVVAACVLLNPDVIPGGIDDSKKLTDRKRRALNEQIRASALAIGVGKIEPDVIDEVNIYNATKLAMKAALLAIPVNPDFLLIDAVKLHDITISTLSLIRGDQRSVSIAAASIVAKVFRDDLMIEYARQYPEYRFTSHKGYATAAHREALKRYGPTPLHRTTFSPVRDVYNAWKSKQQL
jgi:ribonuclease HII